MAEKFQLSLPNWIMIVSKGAIAKFFVAKIFAITFVSIKLMLYLCPKIAKYGKSVSVWSTC